MKPHEIVDLVAYLVLVIIIGVQAGRLSKVRAQLHRETARGKMYQDYFWILVKAGILETLKKRDNTQQNNQQP